MTRPRLRAELLVTARLVMEPLAVGHAEEAAAAFDDDALHTFMGGSSATADQLRARYGRQIVGQSSDASQSWLNWMLRRSDSGELIGTVQATVTHVALDGDHAELAWVVSTAHHHQGYARESATAMADWLRDHGVTRSWLTSTQTTTHQPQWRGAWAWA